MKNETPKGTNIKNCFAKYKSFFADTKEKFSKFSKVFKILTLVILVFAILGQANYIYLENRSMWQDRLSGAKLEGALKKDQMSEKLQKIFDNYLDRKTQITINNNAYYLKNRSLGITFDLEKTHQKFFPNDYNLSFLSKYLKRLTTIYAENNVQAVADINQNILKKNLFSFIPELQNQASEAKIILAENQFIIIPEQAGVTFNVQDLKQQLLKNALEFRIAPLNIKIEPDIPQITEEKAKTTLENFEKLRNKKIILKSENPVLRKELDLKQDLSIFRISRIYNPLNEQPELYIDIDPAFIKSYLEKEIIPEINRESKNIYLSMTDDLEINTTGEIQDGRSVDIAKTIESIQEGFKDNISKKEVTINVTEIPGKIVQPKGVNTGIQELIGYGESSFLGSPNNRRHNIAVAISKFKNIIIMPGEIFSFNKFLGQVNEKTGYKKELVIKEGGKLTIPEYGGGVCQVSTTIFRAALFGGFEIIERHNHSYKVSYYNPDGLDASIYPPRVDFRFKNNTGYPILIQNELDEKSSKAYFRIYGAKNYQEVNLDGPYVYASQPKPKEVIKNYIKSEPKGFYQEKKGQKGFKVYWIRKIIDLDSVVKEEKFYSNYKPVADTINIGGEPPSLTTE